MKVTDIRIRIGKQTENNERLRAYADITFDESFVIHGLKIIDGQNGLFVAMPSRRMPNGEFKDIVHPIKPELRAEITQVILEKFEQESAAQAEAEQKIRKLKVHLKILKYIYINTNISGVLFLYFKINSYYLTFPKQLYPFYFFS